jgi:hypothetical protein
VVALVALAAAMPVLAAVVWTPGATGTITFVNVNQYGTDWQSAPPIDPKGPVGVMSYTAAVLTTQTATPEELVTFAFTASRLRAGVEYALINQFALHDQDDLLHFDVYVLGLGRANRAGLVSIKGCAPLAHLDEDPPRPGLSQVVGAPPRVSGARLGLVPNALLHPDDEHAAACFADADDVVLVSVLGVPIILPENWEP